MSTSNGGAKYGATDRSGHLIEAPLDLPRPVPVSELSAQQRNALIESLVQTVNTNAKALAETRTRCEDLNQRTANLYGDLRTVEDNLEELTSRFVGQRGLVARLRWLLTVR